MKTSMVIILNVISISIWSPVSCKDKCWWTTCQSTQSILRGCGPRRTNLHSNETRSCADGNEYLCCGDERWQNYENERTCWWTGCQSQPYKGCPEYGRLEENYKLCEEGKNFYCCIDKELRAFTYKPLMLPIVPGEVWPTACDPVDWAVRGCRMDTEVGRKICRKGSQYGDEYSCAPRSATPPAPQRLHDMHISIGISVDVTTPE